MSLYVYSFLYAIYNINDSTNKHDNPFIYIYLISLGEFTSYIYIYIYCVTIYLWGLVFSGYSATGRSIL